ncbi:MAG: acetyl-CoA carboxylase biotin carboxyl carrier protein [Candidatus Cellulosilyticum pullistercoris]|uniref:Biotin carboxyl carrier protein of acetyl-CoA carboxylase n=1 Tax=Candidatus Cellulosilyticum pullistercoris TaxID=2838521 RepID=A0A9E2KC24_9FIRM|nr:acetyl-CoA carboxylase biotin carboxyl carrier protein [Candidatus Cellulosilyticum pullistercoris]
MEIEIVKELIASFKEAELTSLSLKCEDFELNLGKEVNVVNVAGNYGGVSMPLQVPQATVAQAESEISSSESELSANKKYIKSPIVGTFYAASSPNGKPFVEVGSRVKKGDVVCVVEAMKLMNEVEAEEDGEILEILVTNEEMVEYGQPLFVIG